MTRKVTIRIELYKEIKLVLKYIMFELFSTSRCELCEWLLALSPALSNVCTNVLQLPRFGQ